MGPSKVKASGMGRERLLDSEDKPYATGEGSWTPLENFDSNPKNMTKWDTGN